MLHITNMVSNINSTIAPRRKLFAICGRCYWCTSIIIGEVRIIEECPKCGSEQNISIIPLEVDTNLTEQPMTLVH